MTEGKCLGCVAMMGGKSIVREAFKYLLSVILRDFANRLLQCLDSKSRTSLREVASTQVKQGLSMKEDVTRISVPRPTSRMGLV